MSFGPQGEKCLHFSGKVISEWMIDNDDFMTFDRRNPFYSNHRTLLPLCI